MRKTSLTALISLSLLSGCGGQSPESAPVFENVSVHDPSVIRVEDTYYVFGSHLASAKSTDLMTWTQISSGVTDDNVLIPNVTEELSETLSWAQSDTLWAPDVIQLADGKFYMYYDACRGDSPLSALGIAVADQIEGPYKNKGIILKSGMSGIGDDGEVYDATQKPNVVDPDVFFDKDGKLWMVYGSYSGGIFILELDPATGFPLEGQGYGKKLLGGNHARIEGPYMLYSPETEYYYLFLSYGGLDANGGYNIRVARAKQPDGPYEDSAGKPMLDAQGTAGVLFDDPAYAPYGVKLMGNHQFMNMDEKSAAAEEGYVSPGHNSAYYDEESGEYYLIFHSRFPGRGEQHEVRVHQMFMNEAGWPVVAPYRYGGEKIGKYTVKDVSGEYQAVIYSKEISAEITESQPVKLNADGTISGSVTGEWSLSDEHTAKLTIEGTEYSGVFLREWSEAAAGQVMTFTVLSADGVPVWGSRMSRE